MIRRKCSWAALLALGVAACASFPATSESTSWPTPRRGMVVSEHPLATQAGVLILERGGNAADAAVATALALAVVYPQAGNLGGGGFALWVPHDNARPPRALDFRETAPAGLSAETFLEDGLPAPGKALVGPLAAAVPGAPMGLWMLHSEHGRLSPGEVAAPAIALAREGFEVDAALAADLLEESSRARLLASPAAAALFYPEGIALQQGERLRQPALARTLEAWASQGPEGFYRGPVAEAVLAEMRRGGGLISAEDLAVYQAKWREPLRGWFRGMEVISMPPPSSGGIALLQVLSILDGFPLDAERDAVLAERSLRPPAQLTSGGGEVGLSARSLHWWIEALRCAFADRAVHLGDPDFSAVPSEQLLAPGWIAARRIGIGEQAQLAPGAWSPQLPEGGGETTHLCVLDEQGNAVSLTTTLNTTFGSGALVEGAGFLLNNELDDFALWAGTPNHYGLLGSLANAPAPNKRPLSSMTPTVLRDNGNSVALVIGSPGGPRIISSIVEVLLRLYVLGQSPAQAVAAPRLHQQWSPAATEFEPGWDELLLQGLRNRGQPVEVREQRWGSVQLIQVAPGGEPVGVSDPRRGGSAQATRD